MRKQIWFCVSNSRKIATAENFSLIRGRRKDTFARTKIRRGGRSPPPLCPRGSDVYVHLSCVIISISISVALVYFQVLTRTQSGAWLSRISACIRFTAWHCVVVESKPNHCLPSSKRQCVGDACSGGRRSRRLHCVAGRHRSAWWACSRFTCFISGNSNFFF